MKISHKLMLINVLALIVFSVGVGLLDLRQSTASIEDLTKSQLDVLVEILKNDFEQLQATVQEQAEQFHTRPGVHEHLKSISTFGPYYVYSDEELGKPIGSSDQVYAKQAQINLLKTVLPMLTSRNIDRVQLYIVSPHNVVPASAPALMMEMTAASTWLIDYPIKGDIQTRQVFQADNQLLALQDASWFEAASMDEALASKVYQANGFSLANADALTSPIQLASDTTWPDQPVEDLIAYENSFGLKASVVLQASILDLNSGEEVPTPVAILMVEKRIDPPLLSFFQEKLHKEVGLVRDDKIVFSTLPMSEPLVLQPGNTLQHQGQSFMYARLPWMEGSQESLGVVALSSMAGLNELQASMMQNIAVLFLVGTLILLLVVHWFTGKVVVRPIQNLQIYAQRLAEGDLDFDIKWHSRDELGQLSSSFSTMRDFIRDRIARVVNHSSRDLKQSANELETNATAMREDSEHVQQSVAQIEQNVSEIKESMHSVATSIQESSTTLGILSDNSTRISQDIGKVAEASDQFSQSMLAVIQRAEAAMKSANNATSAVNKALEVMQQLSDTSTNIDKVVSLISEVATQTRMLALNATIEAASAGQAGLGFSVVATAVKNLALQTSQANEEIAFSMLDVKRYTDHALSSTKKMNTTIVEVRGFNQEIVNDVKKERKGAQELSQRIESIALAGQQSAASITQADSGLKEISKNTSQTAHHVNTIHQRVTQIQSDLERMNQGIVLTNQNSALVSEMAKNLKDAIDFLKY